VRAAGDGNCGRLPAVFASPAQRLLTSRVLHFTLSRCWRHFDYADQSLPNVLETLLTRASHRATSAVSANFPLRPSSSKTLTANLPWRAALRKFTADLNPSTFHNSQPPITGPNCLINSLSISKIVIPPGGHSWSFTVFRVYFQISREP
jgi:hypothetical protein